MQLFFTSTEPREQCDVPWCTVSPCTWKIKRYEPSCLAKIGLRHGATFVESSQVRNWGRILSFIVIFGFVAAAAAAVEMGKKKTTLRSKRRKMGNRLFGEDDNDRKNLNAVGPRSIWTTNGCNVKHVFVAVRRWLLSLDKVKSDCVKLHKRWPSSYPVASQIMIGSTYCHTNFTKPCSRVHKLSEMTSQDLCVVCLHAQKLRWNSNLWMHNPDGGEEQFKSRREALNW